MKATIDKEGTLEIKAESELESYALWQWSDNNIHKCTGEIKRGHFVIYCGDSEYKSKQKVQLKSGEVDL